jgi:hypothetical protein
LLPLIVFVVAQQCPYCRWNACTLTEGSLASCSDCYLVRNQIFPKPGSSFSDENLAFNSWMLLIDKIRSQTVLSKR